jgi:large subunit ribosomal protein L7/L12
MSPSEILDSLFMENENVVIPAKFESIVKQIEEMSVLDLNELVKLFEKKFGVSAAATAAAPATAAAEEKTDFTVTLISDGGAKIALMKIVKEALGLGLKEAKDLVDNLPAKLKEGAKKEEAEALKKQIEDAGGKVELK